VLPSHQENFGIAVAEALACGTPALISKKVNIWREIEQDEAGIVADDDFEGTCYLLQTWLALQGEKRQLMKEHAIQCFRNRFEITKSAESIVAAITPFVPSSSRTNVMADVLDPTINFRTLRSTPNAEDHQKTAV